MINYYENIKEFAEEMGVENLITADGLDEAFLGVADRFGKEPVAVYDYDMCIQILMRDGDMDYSEAIEFFEFNTIGAYISDDQPIYLHINPDLFQPVKTTRSSHLIPRFSGTIDNCPPDAPRSNDWLGL